MCRRFHAHPGELAVAERFAADVQRRLAAAACAVSGSAGGPEGSAAALRVAVTVHTDEAMFIYSQPALTEDDGAQPVRSSVCGAHRLVPLAALPLAIYRPYIGGARERSQRLAGRLSASATPARTEQNTLRATSPQPTRKMAC